MQEPCEGWASGRACGRSLQASQILGPITEDGAAGWNISDARWIRGLLHIVKLTIDTFSPNLGGRC